MALTDNELLDFDASTLAMAEPGDARRLLREHGDVFRAQLVMARWLLGWHKRTREKFRTLPDETWGDGWSEAVLEIVAHLRQGDFLPGGTHYEDEQTRTRDDDEESEQTPSRW